MAYYHSVAIPSHETARLFLSFFLSLLLLFFSFYQKMEGRTLKFDGLWTRNLLVLTLTIITVLLTLYIHVCVRILTLFILRLRVSQHRLELYSHTITLGLTFEFITYKIRSKKWQTVISKCVTTKHTDHPNTCIHTTTTCILPGV